MVTFNYNDKKITFTEFYQNTYKKIFNYIYRLTLNQQNAEDLTGSTFLKAFDFLHRTGPKAEINDAWLYKIALNVFYSFKKKHTRNQVISLDDENNHHLFHHITDDNEQLDNILTNFIMAKNILSKLKPLENIIIQLYYFDELTYKEVAQLVGLKEDNVRKKMQRIIQKMRKIILQKKM